MQFILNLFASLHFFFIVAGIFLASTIFAGLFPKYDIFGIWPFRLLMILVVISLIACSIKRWQAVKNKFGVLITHSAILLLFIGVLINGIYSKQGFLPIEIGEKTNTYLSNDEKELPLPFEVLLKDFRIIYWENEKHIVHAVRKSDNFSVSKQVELNKTVTFDPFPLSVTAVRYYPNFVMGNTAYYSKDDSPQNPCLELDVQERTLRGRMFLFALYPDFHGRQSKKDIKLTYEYMPGRIKQFESDIVIFENGKEVASQTLWVNKPFVWKGWKFYQSGYEEKNLRLSILQISTDPGKHVVGTGFFLLLSGLAWAFLRPRKGDDTNA